MKLRILPLFLAVLLLSGCKPMLERSDAVSTPHIQFSDESENADILRAETYQGLLSALLHLVSQGSPQGVIRLYQYVSLTGAAATDVDRACLEVTQEDPLGAYAVNYIRYDVEQTSSYYEVTVDLAYTRTREQINSVISVTGASAIMGELSDLLAETPEEVVFRISYFTENDSAETLRREVLDAYQAARETADLPYLAQVEVNLYPAEGPQRTAELLLTWGEENFEEIEA